MQVQSMYARWAGLPSKIRQYLKVPKPTQPLRDLILTCKYIKMGCASSVRGHTHTDTIEKKKE